MDACAFLKIFGPLVIVFTLFQALLTICDRPYTPRLKFFHETSSG